MRLRITLHNGEFICYLNIAALNVDVPDAEGDATIFICFDLNGPLAIFALHGAIDGLHGNGGTTV
jgi:hypothetical protein